MGTLCRIFPGGNVTDRVETASTVTIPSTLSIFYKFKLTALPGAGATAAFEDNNFFSVVDSSGNLTFGASWSGVNGAWSTNVTLSVDGLWHTVLVTYDGTSTTNKPALWFDAVSKTVTQTTAPTGSFGGSQLWTIGNGNGGGLAINGAMSMPAMWNTNTLAQTEATRLNNGDPPCAVFQGNLLYYWPLDNGNSPEPDVIGGKNGTVTGTTTGTGAGKTPNPRCSPLQEDESWFSAVQAA